MCSIVQIVGSVVIVIVAHIEFLAAATQVAFVTVVTFVAFVARFAIIETFIILNIIAIAAVATPVRHNIAYIERFVDTRINRCVHNIVVGKIFLNLLNFGGGATLDRIEAARTTRTLTFSRNIVNAAVEVDIIIKNSRIVNVCIVNICAVFIVVRLTI